MGNMDGIPRRCKVTAVAAACWFTDEIGLKMSFCGEDKERGMYQPLAHSDTLREMGFWKYI
jgi:hypothetical protein